MKTLVAAIIRSLVVFIVFCFIKDGWDARTWPDEQQAVCGLTMAVVGIFSVMFASEKG